MAAPPILVKALPATGAPLQRWDELLDVHRKYFGLSGRWVFRGINNSKYGLKTSLERAVLSLALSTPNPTPDEERSALAGTFGDLKRTVKSKAALYGHSAVNCITTWIGSRRPR